MTAPTPGVLLMTYGSPASLEREDIRGYLARVRGGREPDADLVDEFTRRYRVIGGSPLVAITRAQAAALARHARAGPSRSACASPSRRSRRAAGARRPAWRRERRRDHPLAAVLAAADGRLRGARSRRRATTTATIAPDVDVAGRLAPGAGVRRRARARVDEALAALPPTTERRPSRPADGAQPAAARRRPGARYLAQLRETAEAVARGGLTWTEDWRSAGRAPATSPASG